MCITDTKDSPWQKIYLDIMGPWMTSGRGMRYVLTCQDNLSKYSIATPLENQTSEKVTEAFVKNVIFVYGIPSEIVTDQGTNFMGEVFERICKPVFRVLARNRFSVGRTYNIFKFNNEIQVSVVNMFLDLYCSC
jgi:hypothetical protein